MTLPGDTTGARIKWLRKARGWSQQGLAKKASVSQPTISLWENDVVVPTGLPLRRVADALGTTPEFLMAAVAA